MVEDLKTDKLQAHEATISELLVEKERAEYERDRYREALEEIHGFGHSTNSSGALFVRALHIAREALNGSS